jgi:hypothetical protein
MSRSSVANLTQEMQPSIQGQRNRLVFQMRRDIEEEVQWRLHQEWTLTRQSRIADVAFCNLATLLRNPFYCSSVQRFGERQAATMVNCATALRACPLDLELEAMVMRAAHAETADTG